MEIKILPNNYDGPSGTVSYIRYKDSRFDEAMRVMFNASPREEITEVVLDRDGIKAKFEVRR